MMKIYFAGPLFTPYVRDFISKHAQILRDNGIDPFVPHESFNPEVTADMVDLLLGKGLLTEEQLDKQPAAELVVNLMRTGRVKPQELGLPRLGPETIFDKDMEGVSSANAVVALLDGTQVDDGTACEIGIFYGLSRRDPTKKGIAAFTTDSRGVRKPEHGYGINMFVLGVIDEIGQVFVDFDDVVEQLKQWERELQAEGHGAG
jgi:nucleoside 2-deoxyribosyltransferase